MTTVDRSVQRRRFAVPREDRGSLAEPSLDSVPRVLAENASRRDFDYDVQGCSLDQLTQSARQAVVAEATRYTRAYRDVEPPASDGGPIFMAGHQPGLFHPGVWFKNYALDALTRRHGGVAINLVVDSDTLKTPTAAVPGGTVDAPTRRAIAFDRSEAALPYEERRIADPACFAGFADRVIEQMGSLVPEPSIADYWPLAVRRMQQTDNLGECLAQSRHQWEGQWGLQTLEIPQSRVCRSEPFLRFVAHLLAQLPRFRTAHNESLAEYRRAHRIRGGAHPVPDLAAEGDYLEAPFWIWTTDDPRRRPLYVRRRGRRLVLSDRDRLELELPLHADGDASRAVDVLADQAERGVKIRCRALITTLWSRLVLGDLFIHGIGGAKYDQVTDAIIRRFFEIEPPEFLVLSATIHLPVGRLPEPLDDPRAIDGRLRELTWNPQRFVNGFRAEENGSCGSPAQWIAAKKRWIDTPQTPANARTRFRRIRRINEDLQPCVAALREQFQSERDESNRLLQARQLLTWREYAFCLYPGGLLHEFLGGLVV
ncbi:MAG: hypothetical protein HQ581_17730 [Planctomycetes bacterium]|nr:hypothetical protein [Planctomycetota bacterium]